MRCRSWLQSQFNTINGKLDQIMSEQSHLEADVATLTTFVNDIEAEVAALKAANPDVDFTSLDALVATVSAEDPGPQPTPPAA